MAERRLLDSPWLYFVGALALIAAAVLSQVDIRRTIERPVGQVDDLLELSSRDDLNVVFIVVDMLRADRLTSYGYSRNTSPTLAGLAKTGIQFQNVESQSSWTKASMASMWLGQYPETTGIQRYGHGLSDDLRMPAEILGDAGWRTGGIWRNGWIANNFGFGQGFELYFRPPAVDRKGTQRGNASTQGKVLGTDYDGTEAAIGFIESYMDERFFLYIHYMDVHQFLYADTSPEFGSTLSDYYDAAIHWTDRNIGFIYQSLRDRNLLDKTLIVIASDHGESFFEHGAEGHARTLFREVQQVPLFIIPPFRIEGGLQVEDQVANVDIWPTILDLVGAPELEAADGRSLVPLILAAGNAQAQPDPDAVEELRGRAVYSQLDQAWGRVEEPDDPLTSMVKDSHRLIVDHNQLERGKLYDHSADPLEQQNLYQDSPELAASMEAELNAFLESLRQMEGGVEPEEVELDEMRLHQLRALGYVLERPEDRKGKKADDAEEGGEEAAGQGD